MKHYGMVIKVKREALGLTQAELGRLASITGPTISSIESGREVSELVLKSVKYAITNLEDAMSREEKDKYLFKYYIGTAELEDDPNRKMLALNKANISLGFIMKNLIEQMNG